MIYARLGVIIDKISHMPKFTDKIKRAFRKYVSPAFLVMLLISMIIWYLTKLSYTYTAQVPVSLDVGGNKFKVTCIAEGTGYRILSHRLFRKHDINLSFRDVQATPSVVNDGYFVIGSYSLQNAISAQISDLKIISVGGIPEIKIPYTD